MRKQISFIFLILAIAMCIVASKPNDLGFIDVINADFKLISVAYVLFVCGFVPIFNSGYKKVITYFFLYLVIANSLDEWFFDPFTAEYNEWLSSAIILIILIFEKKKTNGKGTI